MPTWLQGFAMYQPVSAVIESVRDVLLGAHATGGSTGTDTLQTIAWCVGIPVVFAPIAVRRYRIASEFV